MPKQTTSLKTINNEKLIIKELASLNSTNDIILNDTGWDSRVYSFGNGNHYFKFPRSSRVKELYKYEIIALKRIQKIDTPVVTQKIIWEHPNNDYFGYEGIQGKSLGETISSLTSKEKIATGNDIGYFLNQLHMIKLTGTREFTIEKEVEQIVNWYKSKADVIKDIFTLNEQHKLEQLVYFDWPAKLKELGSKPVFSHGDLDDKNIIYSNTGRIGIIDFGDVAYYDRSKDFLELNKDSTIYKNVLKAYDYNSALLDSKIAIRQQMIQIINLGYYSGKSNKVNLAKTVNLIKNYLN